MRMFPLAGKFLVATVLVVVPIGVSAQGGPAQTVEVVRVRDLDFGVVIAGIPAAILPSDAGAAEFEVSAPPNTTLFITFSLPAQLLSGADVLPVSFGAGSAQWSQRRSAAGRTMFDPRVGTQVDLERGRNIYLWLGAAISPPGLQPAGAYRGVVTLTTVLN